MLSAHASAGAVVAPASAVIEVRVGARLARDAGWVAMWRPLEVFLYDWWPIRAEIRLFERLSTMPVSIEYKGTASSDAWRSDWPAVVTPAR